MWHLISGRRRADLAPALQLKHCKKKKEEKKKKKSPLQSVPIEFALSSVFESRGGL